MSKCRSKGHPKKYVEPCIVYNQHTSRYYHFCAKYNDLLSLCKAGVIPIEHKLFFENLSVSIAVTEDIFDEATDWPLLSIQEEQTSGCYLLQSGQ